MRSACRQKRMLVSCDQQLDPLVQVSYTPSMPASLECARPQYGPSRPSGIRRSLGTSRMGNARHGGSSCVLHGESPTRTLRIAHCLRGSVADARGGNRDRDLQDARRPDPGVQGRVSDREATSLKLEHLIRSAGRSWSIPACRVLIPQAHRHNLLPGGAFARPYRTRGSGEGGRQPVAPFVALGNRG